MTSFQILIRALLLSFLSLFFSASFAMSPDSIRKASGSKITQAQAQQIYRAVHKYSLKNDLDPQQVFAIIAVESTYNPKATNRYTRAAGLMQVYTKYHLKKIAGRNIYAIDTNVEVGTRIYKEYLDECSGNTRCAMRKYGGTSLDRYAIKIERTKRSYNLLAMR